MGFDVLLRRFLHDIPASTIPAHQLLFYVNHTASSENDEFKLWHSVYDPISINDVVK
jgi:hypothetical protein